MGGRGRASDQYYAGDFGDSLGDWLVAERQRRGYVVLSANDLPPGMSYPMLEGLSRQWRLVSHKVGREVTLLEEDRLGASEPTLRWVSDAAVHDLYVDGMTIEEYLSATGLTLDMTKGGFVLSKRLSRLMRPYRWQSRFAADQLRVSYLEQDRDQAKLWDGAGLISRGLVRELVDDEQEAEHLGRVEFTLLSENGQDKGHAIVVDELRDGEGNAVDILLPQDSKREVRGRRGEWFVGLQGVHGKDQLRLDIQSLIHLKEFFDSEMLLQRLHEEGALFCDAVSSGHAAEAMGRIDGAEPINEIQRWYLREYLASGGDLRWSGTPAKALLGQHLKRLNASTLAKLRLPLPGGRYYVMPAGVGAAGGVALSVERGEIHLDHARGTAWVNDADWLILDASPNLSGLADVWGGADNDDALWLYPFTDEADGERKVLAWRSPNQLGEYVVLRPTADSVALTWKHLEGEVAYPPADSRHLPGRIDHSTVPSLGWVDGESVTGVGEGASYSIEGMMPALERARANQGALGMYCNALMLHKALFGSLPDELPAPLEDVIDGTVKSGADLSRIKAWCYAHSDDLLARGVHIPDRLRQRLSIDRAREPWGLVPPVLRGDESHWLDELERGVSAHISAIGERQAQMGAQAMPPDRLFDLAFDDPESIRLGGRYNQAYATAVRAVAEQREADRDSLDARATEAVDRFLTGYDQQQRSAILRKELFQEEWRGLARGRPSGAMSEWDRAEAVRRAEVRLHSMSSDAREAELRGRLWQRERFRMEQADEAGFSRAEQDGIRETMEWWLDQYPADRQRAILRGALVSRHMRDEVGSDAALWLPGAKDGDGGQARGIAGRTIDALREVCLLDELDEVALGGAGRELLRYPVAEAPQPRYATMGISGVWRNWLAAQGAATSDGEAISTRERKRSHRAVEQLAREICERPEGYLVELRQEGEALVAYTERGHRFGVLRGESAATYSAGERLRLRGALASDGNLRVVGEVEGIE